MAHATGEELRSYIGLADNVYDGGHLQSAVDTASSWIDSYCGRTFVLAADVPATTIVYETTNAGSVYTNDIGSTADLVVETSLRRQSWNVVDPSWVYLAPDGADVRPTPQPWTEVRLTYGFFYGFVRVTAHYGWPEVPAPVKQACLIQGHRLFKRAESPYGIEGFDAGVLRVGSIDTDVAALLAPYRTSYAAFGIG